MEKSMIGPAARPVLKEKAIAKGLGRRWLAAQVSRPGDASLNGSGMVAEERYTVLGQVRRVPGQRRAVWLGRRQLKSQLARCTRCLIG